MPKRSRTAAASDRLLMTDSRPDISVKSASIAPAIAIAQSSWKPYSAPACADVEIDPTSTKPPILVTIPRMRSTIALIAGPAYRRAGTPDAGGQPADQPLAHRRSSARSDAPSDPQYPRDVRRAH